MAIDAFNAQRLKAEQRSRRMAVVAVGC